MHEARIIFPTKTQKGEKIPDRKLKRFGRWLAAAFGGFTQTEGRGVYKHPDGHLQSEVVYIIDIGMDFDDIWILIGIAETFATECEQECVYVRKPDGEVIFVEPGLSGIGAENG